MNWLVTRIRIAVLERRLEKLLRERNRVMNLPDATTRWTTDEMQASAVPIRILQLKIQALWDTL